MADPAGRAGARRGRGRGCHRNPGQPGEPQRAQQRADRPAARRAGGHRRGRARTGRAAALGRAGVLLRRRHARGGRARHGDRRPRHGGPAAGGRCAAQAGRGASRRPVRAGGSDWWPRPTWWCRPTRSSFAFTEVRLGLAAATISLTCLERMADRAAATAVPRRRHVRRRRGRTGRADHPRRRARQVDAAVAEVVDALRQGTPQGLRETKAVVNARLLARIDADGEQMAALSARLFASEESQTAMRAFLDRKPREPAGGGSVLRVDVGVQLDLEQPARVEQAGDDEHRAGRVGRRRKARRAPGRRRPRTRGR